YLRESILYSKAKVVKGYDAALMPSYQGQLTEEQVNQLVAYIKTLSPNNPGNQMDLGIKMNEQNPVRPEIRSRNSDSGKRDYK
ncbi:MAG: cytochrome c oxidase, subunit, partial [Phycisphaerales bacterium]|nr:cytochrome c oxidase, subunit [Phycisphaerales bacterium]